MAGLFRVLTVVTLTVHLTMGCCWHHAHGCPDDASQASSPHQAMPGAACSCNDAPSDHGSHGCHEPKCSFVAASRLVVDATAASGFAQATSGALLNDPSSREGFSSFSLLSSMDRLLPPVRLHLAHQVLLI